jgi:dATP pyrophosphohydrolase
MRSPSKSNKVQVWIYQPKTGGSAGEFEVLLLKMIPQRGGAWQPVTGGVEETDVDLAAAAYREAFEETGLRFSGHPEPLNYQFEFESRWGGVICEHAFALQALGNLDGKKVQLDPNEHTDFQWESAEKLRQLGAKELRALLVYESVEMGMQKLFEFLSKKQVVKGL